MGRAPCCDKANVKKGPWSPDEDATLKAYIEEHGTGGNWIALPQKIGLKRCGKSCRLRWLNYLRPNIRHGGFSEEEDNIICNLYISIGSRWSIIAAQLPGRTDNDIKNYWNTRLKKKLLGKQRKEQQARRGSSVKQELKRETDYNYLVPGPINQTAYWPELPSPPPAVVALPGTNQDPHLKDQECIRNLLLKLGGRFSAHDDHHQQANSTANINIPTNFQYPVDVSFTQDQLYENSINMISSSTNSISTPLNSSCSQLPNSYNVNELSPNPHPNTFQGFENFPMELSELFYNNQQQQLDGLDDFYGMEMVDGSSGTSSVESSSWGDISSMSNYSYPQIASGFEACKQSMPQVPTFEESSYFGPQ